MPQVKFVNLSFNRLSEQLNALNEHAANNSCWSSLRNLVLNSTRIDWNSVQMLLNLLPALEELHLSLNEYAHIDLGSNGFEDHEMCQKEISKNTDTPSDDNRNTLSENFNGQERLNGDETNENMKTYPQVKKLHFSGNPVDNWREICKLGIAFPNLESLVLNNCPVKTLQVESTNPNGQEYSRSESECESGTPIDSPHNNFRFVLLPLFNMNTYNY